MLDLPELLTPASRVRGRIWIVCASEIDLKPATEIVEIDGGLCGDPLEFPFDFDIWISLSLDKSQSLSEALSQEPRRLGSDSVNTRKARRRRQLKQVRVIFTTRHGWIAGAESRWTLHQTCAKNGGSCVQMFEDDKGEGFNRRSVLKGLAGLGVGTVTFRRAVAAQVAQAGTVTPEMIKQAEWIAGLELTDDERTRTARSVQRSLQSFAELRKVDVGYDVAPALTFFPVPPRPAAAIKRNQARPVDPPVVRGRARRKSSRS